MEAFGETYQILVKTQAIQADGFTDPATALDTGFEPIDETSIPWDNDHPTKGGTLNAALHYLNSDPTGAEILGSVTNIVFGKSADYPEIVDNYDGILVDEEQDMDVYVYQVENKAKAADGTYSIYVLSDGVIYAPKDSMDLFRNMKKLESINASGLDVSRVESLESAFRSCTSLKTIYVGDGWDMSKVTSSAAMFSNCTNLVGGNGTTYMGSDLKYACVDTPAVVDEEGNVITEAIPGYLTYKAAEKTFP